MFVWCKYFGTLCETTQSSSLAPPPPPPHSPSPPITSRKQNSIRKCAYQLPQLHMQRPDAQMYLKSKLCRLLFPRASKHGCVIQNQTSSPKINSHYSPYPMLGSASQWVYCIPSRKGGDCPETKAEARGLGGSMQHPYLCYNDWYTQAALLLPWWSITPTPASNRCVSNPHHFAHSCSLPQSQLIAAGRLPHYLLPVTQVGGALSDLQWVAKACH